MNSESSPKGESERRRCRADYLFTFARIRNTTEAKPSETVCQSYPEAAAPSQRRPLFFHFCYSVSVFAEIFIAATKANFPISAVLDGNKHARAKSIKCDLRSQGETRLSKAKNKADRAMQRKRKRFEPILRHISARLFSVRCMYARAPLVSQLDRLSGTAN